MCFKSELSYLLTYLLTHRKMPSLSDEPCITRSHQKVTFWSTIFISISMSTPADQDQVWWACILCPHGTHSPPTSTTFLTLIVSKSFWELNFFSRAFNIHWRFRDFCSAPMVAVCAINFYIMMMMIIIIQGDHLYGKPGNVREFVSCQGNVRDFT